MIGSGRRPGQDGRLLGRSLLLDGGNLWDIIQHVRMILFLQLAEDHGLQRLQFGAEVCWWG